MGRNIFCKLFENSLSFLKICAIIYKLKRQLRKKGNESMEQQLKRRQGTVYVEDILIAHHTLKDVVHHTPLQKNPLLSERYECNVYLKREDLQVVRSFKIRGAYNRMKHLSEE